MLSVFENEVWSTYFSDPGIGLINDFGHKSCSARHSTIWSNS